MTGMNMNLHWTSLIEISFQAESPWGSIKAGSWDTRTHFVGVLSSTIILLIGPKNMCYLRQSSLPPQMRLMVQLISGKISFASLLYTVTSTSRRSSSALNVHLI